MACNLVDRMTLIPVNAIARPQVCSVLFRTVIYLVAIVFGAIVMSFQMLGPRDLNPYFGNGIYIGRPPRLGFVYMARALPAAAAKWVW